ncbi:MAG: dockerin type I domain-containing protein, partial [Acidimicrobiia bacterium]|nr:dockerin type I domain-containing protein [Acidimicrobiia bacterium]
DSVLFYRRVIPRTFNNVQVRTDSTGLGIVYVAGINVAGVDSVRNLFDLVLDHSFLLGTTSPIVVQPMQMSGIQPAFRDLLSTTTVVTENGLYCAATGRWGDLDNDGFANSRDGLAVLTDVVGLPTAGFDLTRADVSNDGVGNTLDALVLISHAVGLEIPGMRVLLPVAPGCAQATTPQLTLDPDTVELVPGQTMSPLVQTADAGGDGAGRSPQLAVAEPGGGGRRYQRGDHRHDPRHGPNRGLPGSRPVRHRPGHRSGPTYRLARQLPRGGRGGDPGRHRPLSV